MKRGRAFWENALRERIGLLERHRHVGSAERQMAARAREALAQSVDLAALKAINRILKLTLQAADLEAARKRGRSSVR